MSVPVLLAVALNMQAALQQIARASGYFTDVKATSVVLNPVMLQAVPVTETPWVNVGHLIAPVPPRNFATTRPTAILDRWRFTLEAAIDAPGTDNASKLTAMANFAADVEVALCVDLQRGGLCQYTYVLQETQYPGSPEQTRVYVEIPVEVTLRRNFGQP